MTATPRILKTLSHADALALRLEQARDEVMDDPSLLLDLMPDEDVRDLAYRVFSNVWNKPQQEGMQAIQEACETWLNWYMNREMERGE